MQEEEKNPKSSPEGSKAFKGKFKEQYFAFDKVLDMQQLFVSMEHLTPKQR